MLDLKGAIGQIFRQAWRRWRMPMAQVIWPMSYWALPTGVVFDPLSESLMSDGIVVGNAQDYWVSSLHYFVPGGRSNIEAWLRPGGELERSELVIAIQGADVPYFENAFLVEIGGREYNVQEIRPMPPADPLWAVCRLVLR